ncbi:FUSC family protein [Testudinibacter sp. P80/BLE/0925]|uniref:FUSC family protein n=1 Tax=Testudinibacter sp. TW-1 TaxID=3417757 RepID=UPI003D35C490
MWKNDISAWCGAIYWREAFLGVPGIILVLTLSGIFNGTQLMVMLGAAFSVAFGAARTLGKRRWGAMLAAVLGMAVAAFIGSIAGFHPPLMLILTALLAAACAALASYDNSLWWVMLQVGVAFMIAGYYPNHSEHAALRALAVLFGGLLQIGCTMLFAHLSPKNAAPLPDSPPIAKNQSWRFVVAIALAVAAALYSAQYFGLKNDYWAPMSAFLILRPVAQATLTRGINRLIGTLLGCVVATLLIYAFHDNLPILVFFLLLTVAGALAMQRAHYGLFSFMVSATIVLLIALGHGDPIATTEHRLIATLLGGAIAIAMAKLFRL